MLRTGEIFPGPWTLTKVCLSCLFPKPGGGRGGGGLNFTCSKDLD